MVASDMLCRLHPTVGFGYFAVLFAVSCSTGHPLFLLCALIFSAWYFALLRGRAALALLKTAIPLFLMTALINPLFSHRGKTVLGYLPGGNPLTLESIGYGLTAGLMLTAMLFAFAAFSVVLSDEKVLYLFGRFLPAFALLLSMTLRFVPQFTARMKTVRETQELLGRPTGRGKLRRRIRNAVACFSITVSWSLENAIETADSMKSRGYGTAKRTAYSPFRWSRQDGEAAVFFLFCAGFLLTVGLSGGLAWHWFPGAGALFPTEMTAPSLILFAAFCAFPVYQNRKEARTWTHSESNI